jgi:hypothetical protein
MKQWHGSVFFSLMLGLNVAHAQEWKVSGDGALYGYAIQTSLADASVLNPQNQIAMLAEWRKIAEVRYNFKARYGGLQMSARPIIMAQNAPDSGSSFGKDAFLSQWQVQMPVSEYWSASAGREVLNWGAGQYRSPSSPFYFDNGRNNPVRELSGMDVVKLAWTPGLNTTLTFGKIMGSGHMAKTDDPWENGWLAKWDQRGESWAGGMVMAKPSAQPAFIGVYGQKTLGDAWLMYGEASAGSLRAALVSPSDPALPFAVQANTPRRGVWLLGASYTLESGDTLHAEWLHDNAGYSGSESAAYFNRAASSPLQAGLALAYAPRLLNRNYLHLIGQTSLTDTNGFTRLMFTRNLDSGGNEFGAYTEQSLSNRVSLYGLAVISSGGAKSEFSSLFNRLVMIGCKISLP